MAASSRGRGAARPTPRRMAASGPAQNDRTSRSRTHPFGWAAGAGWTGSSAADHGCDRGWPERPPVSALGDEALAHGASRRLRAALRVKLVEDVAQVELHGVLGQAEPSGDLLVREASDDAPQNLELALGELVGDARGGNRVRC